MDRGDDREGLPSAIELAPAIDRLAAIAERELHEPLMVDVKLWDDRDWSALAQHTFGVYEGGEWQGREVIRYDPETEEFEARYLEEHVATGITEVLLEEPLDAVCEPSQFE